MYAWQPWSGHYSVPPTVWATAHTTQFVEPGWKMLHGGSGDLAQGGSYLTMVSPDGRDFSTIIETGHAHCPVCSANNAGGGASNVTQRVSIRLLGAVARTETAQVWHTDNDTRSFVHVGPAVVHAGAVELAVAPESIYTVTTTTGQTRAGASAPRPRRRPPSRQRGPTTLTRAWSSRSPNSGRISAAASRSCKAAAAGTGNPCSSG